jgi:hypothetical protein
MVDDDQAEFVSALIQGAEKVLSDAGRLKDKEKVRYLFTTNAAGDKISIGMTEFIINLALVRVDDAENAKTHPNDPRLEVEDAMFLTLQKNHIDLPDSFFTVASNFKPKFPPQSKEKKEKKN